MKKTTALLLILCLLLSSCTPGSPTESPEPLQSPGESPLETPAVSDPASTDSPDESPSLEWSTPEELLALMTTDEKIGQMTQCERGDLNPYDVTNYFIGSVLSGGGSTPAQNNPEGWVDMVDGFVGESLRTRLAIPVLYGIDAVHGHNNVQDATLFPHNISLGAIAAGDLEKGILATHTAAEYTRKEMLATGIYWTFAPVLGIPEDIRWGRTYEGYSEDVTIVTLLGTAAVMGIQGDDKENPLAAACMKHYLGEGQTQNGQNQGNALLTDDDINRLLPPYAAAIEAGALTLMPSFSSVDGLKMHEHKELLTDLLKEELGFEGFIVSDWAALRQLSGADYKEQIANAINAGVDMVMATNEGRDGWVQFVKLMRENVAQGAISMERIDDAVLRILRVKEKLGLFENPKTVTPGEVGGEEHRTAARDMAADSLVLLKNDDDILSRLPDFQNILLAGQGAEDMGMQCGGWSISWQGSHGDITTGTTIAEGFTEAGVNFVYAENGVSQGEFDCAVVVIGEDPYAETDGDRSNHINLRPNDLATLENVYKLGCPVVVIMLSGRPMTIGDELEHWDAFIAAWLPGTEGGSAIADLLFGGRSFVGRLPYTWPSSIGGDTLFPFGHGLAS